ncbi:hypothetical protein ACOSP7_013213 [Xanthoceras sorbifolium]
MDTRSKTNAEFRTEVNEALAHHDTNFDVLNNNFSRVSEALQGVMTELQALRIAQSNSAPEKEINSFATGETFLSRPSIATTSNLDRNHMHLKLNFPTYGGDDPMGWIFKAEQYFEFKNIESHQQNQLASFHLEGVVLHRFGPTDYDDPSKALLLLKQTTSVNAYQKAFERLSHKVDDLPENFLVGCFMTRLKDEI